MICWTRMLRACVALAGLSVYHVACQSGGCACHSDGARCNQRRSTVAEPRLARCADVEARPGHHRAWAWFRPRPGKCCRSRAMASGRWCASCRREAISDRIARGIGQSRTIEGAVRQRAGTGAQSVIVPGQDRPRIGSQRGAEPYSGGTLDYFVEDYSRTPDTWVADITAWSDTEIDLNVPITAYEGPIVIIRLLPTGADGWRYSQRRIAAVSRSHYRAGHRFAARRRVR